jgi:prepilin-type N-terminal cleavage/methylation domain-containing protein
VRRGLHAVARDERGFTLTELLVTVALVGVVTAATAMLYVTGNTMFMTGTNRAEAQQGARAAMLIQDDLRMIGYGVPGSEVAIRDASAASLTFRADLNDATTHLAADVSVNDTTITVDSAAGIRVGDVVCLNNGQQSEPLTVVGIAGNVVSVGSGTTAAYPRGVQVGVPRMVVYAYDAATGTVTRDAGDGSGAVPVVTGVQSFAFTYYDSGNNVTNVRANIRRIRLQMTVQSAGGEAEGAMSMDIDVRPRNLA